MSDDHATPGRIREVFRAFLLLAVWKLPAWAVVALLAGGGVLVSL